MHRSVFCLISAILAALVLALRVLRRSGGGSSCGCGSAGSCSGTGCYRACCPA